MPDKYYVIHTGTDGETRISVETEKSLLKKIKEKYWGSDVNFAEDEDFAISNHFNCQLGDTGDVLIILKGPIVTPKAVQKITEWEI